MHRLSLDPSTAFGWCLYLDDSGKPEGERRPINERLFYDTWELRRDADGKKLTRRGQLGIRFIQLLNGLLRKHGIEEEAVEIVLEGESYGSQKSEAGRALASMWPRAMEIWADKHDRDYPVICAPDEWRKFFIGQGKAPREIGAGLSDRDRFAARREWVKQAVLAECRKRNLKPKNDNEADAIGMMFWLVNDGPAAQEAKREEKKAKAQAKRAQKSLPLQVAA